MQAPPSAHPIVVGIDGSPAALHAARWAAVEATGRGVPLRLVHVVDVEDDVDRSLGEDPAVIARDWPDTLFGLEVLRAAAAAVAAEVAGLTLETQILYGEIDSTLVDESERAAMMCVGSVGITPYCRSLVGSTAATVAERARCPVAIIRPQASTAISSSSSPQWIVAVVDDMSAGDRIVECAVAEAHLRRAHVLVLGAPRRGRQPVRYDELERQIPRWRAAHPDVHVYPVSIPSSPEAFLAHHDELSVQLAVLGAGAATEAPTLVGPHRPTHSEHDRRSVLVVR